MVKLLCNVHDEMLAFILVLENPYYAPTDGSGRFTIPGIRAGRYQVKVWHEKFTAPAKTVAEARDLSLREGLLLLLVYFAGGVFLLRGFCLKFLPPLPRRDFGKEPGPSRFAIVAALLLLMGGVVGKILLRLLFGVKYVLVTPWFHI